MATVDLVYDPYDYAIDANPHPVWKRLRDEAPVYYNEKYDFYALSRFDDVLAASLDPETFCSGHTTVLEIMEPEDRARSPDRSCCSWTRPSTRGTASW